MAIKQICVSNAHFKRLCLANLCNILKQVPLMKKQLDKIVYLLFYITYFKNKFNNLKSSTQINIALSVKVLLPFSN